jgi:hypothetical protein
VTPGDGTASIKEEVLGDNVWGGKSAWIVASDADDLKVSSGTGAIARKRDVELVGELLTSGEEFQGAWPP